MVFSCPKRKQPYDEKSSTKDLFISIPFYFSSESNMFFVIILAGLLTFAFCPFPLLNSGFLQKLVLRFTVAGTVRELHPIPFSFQNTGNQNFCKDSFLCVFTKKPCFALKMLSFRYVNKKEQPFSILKTAIHPTTLLFIYVIF